MDRHDVRDRVLRILVVVLSVAAMFTGCIATMDEPGPGPARVLVDTVEVGKEDLSPGHEMIVASTRQVGLGRFTFEVSTEMPERQYETCGHAAWSSDGGKRRSWTHTWLSGEGMILFYNASGRPVVVPFSRDNDFVPPTTSVRGTLDGRDGETHTLTLALGGGDRAIDRPRVAVEGAKFEPRTVLGTARFDCASGIDEFEGERSVIGRIVTVQDARRVVEFGVGGRFDFVFADSEFERGLGRCSISVDRDGKSLYRSRSEVGTCAIRESLPAGTYELVIEDGFAERPLVGFHLYDGWSTEEGASAAFRIPRPDDVRPASDLQGN